jgi:hypothetical protein
MLLFNWSMSPHLKVSLLVIVHKRYRKRRKSHSRTANDGTRRNLHAVRSKSRSHHILRLLTPAIRIRALASRHLDTVACLNIRPSIPSGFEVSETKVSNSRQSGKDDRGQANAQEELHEHVHADRWCGVRACRHVYVRRQRSRVWLWGLGDSSGLPA